MHGESKQGRFGWSSRRGQEPPDIVINGVGYRSPEAMPADVRKVWDEAERELEQRGIDWRQQKRIVLEWRREGNTVKHTLNVEGAHRPRQISQWTLRGAAFFAVVLAWVGLFLYGLGWQDPPLVFATSDIFLDVVFALVFALWLWMFVKIYRRRESRSLDGKSAKDDFLLRSDMQSNPFLNPDTPGWKLAGMTLLIMACVLGINYAAIYGGGARILHYTERTPGSVTTTVTAKHPFSSRHARCAPRLEFEGFRSVGNELCVDRQFFDRIEIGDRVRITGRTSRYAVEPEKLELTQPTLR